MKRLKSFMLVLALCAPILVTAEAQGKSHQPAIPAKSVVLHLPYFNLINMNGRLYDPAIGRFLSPDPYVQMPESSQNFNRYTYALNNPLKYNNPNGEFFLFTIFNAVTDFLWNIPAHGLNFHRFNWNRTVNAWKIESGMFKGSFGQILNRWTSNLTNSVKGMLIGSILIQLVSLSMFHI